MTSLQPARVLLFSLALASSALAQPPGSPTRPRQVVAPVDPTRAESLYVSSRPEDHPMGNYARDMALKALTDSVFRARSQGVMDFQKVRYRSKVGDLDIPAYLWQPMRKRGPRGHAAMIWVHGGVHGNVDLGFQPFVREAIERGYVIIAPEYRGSTGYGREFHNAIDYGGHEVDDVMTAYDWLVKNLPHVDPDRVGMMGWSHGGFITLHSVLRDQHPFKAAAAMVPVTNLVFRLGLKGPEYQRYFATQARIRGLPFEQPDLYVERSPVYQVPELQIPLLVHVATNDADVDFVEDQQLIWALRALKPDLAETRIYVDPPGGHSFTHQMSRNLELAGTPEQRDSWNRTWAFLEEHLRPFEDPSKPQTPPARN